MRTFCVGGGPAGLYLAILLKRQAPFDDVTVCERAARGHTPGWGIVYWDDLLEQLSHADPQSAWKIRDASRRWSGQALLRDGRETRHDSAGGYALERRRLLEILAERAAELGVCLRYDTEVADASDCPGADLIVASDGSGSGLRRAGAHVFEPRIAAGRNKYIWLGVERTFEPFTFGIAQTAAGPVWFHAYTYGDMSTFIAECGAKTWDALGFARMTPARSAETLSRIFARELDGAALLAGDSCWQNFRTVRNKTWVSGRTVLVGDAAHTAHFSIGSGTKLALEDAMALALALRREPDVETALRAYERERRPAVERHQANARASAGWFENAAAFLDLTDEQLLGFLLERRSRLLASLPPRIARSVSCLSQRSVVLQSARRAGHALLGRFERIARHRRPERREGEGRPAPSAIAPRR